MLCSPCTSTLPKSQVRVGQFFFFLDKMKKVILICRKGVENYAMEKILKIKVVMYENILLAIQ